MPSDHLTDAEFSRDVQTCGGEVGLPFDQAAFLETSFPGHQRGACIELATLWVREQKLKALKRALPSKEKKLAEMQALMEQKARGNGLAAVQEYFRWHEIQQAERFDFPRGLEMEPVKQILPRQPGYYLLGAGSSADGSAHVIAINTAREYPSLFDPNFGEARFRGLDADPTQPEAGGGLLALLEGYWLKAYPDLNGAGFIVRYN